MSKRIVEIELRHIAELDLISSNNRYLRIDSNFNINGFCILKKDHGSVNIMLFNFDVDTSNSPNAWYIRTLKCFLRSIENL